ncbi:MAG: HPr family phosphocarrier protein [Ktedonobacteraceae bacterium]
MATSRDVIVRSKVGLHARPAALFIKTAGGFSARITVENVTRGTKPVNGKSILSLLSAGVKMDDHMRITADGTDEEAAIAALADLVNNNFGEME